MKKSLQGVKLYPLTPDRILAAKCTGVDFERAAKAAGLERSLQSEPLDKLITALLQTLDGKLGGTYPQRLVRRISHLKWDAKGDWLLPASEIDRYEAMWLGPELLRLVQTGDTKTLRQIADARDRLRKDGEMFNRKRFERLYTYLKVYQREGRPPKIKELYKPSGDERRDMHEERAIRKLLNELDLPYTSVPTGHPKGTKNSINPERLRQLRC
jgi:Asp-tRNA(Asn)/Glu-tRNA(Gln) amidotransferase A subunit family amidase